MKIFFLFAKRFWAGIVLGDGIIQKIKAAFGLVFISFLPSLNFKMRKFNKSAEVNFTSGSDVAMWVEVFYDEEYKNALASKPKKIIDLGANIGFTSLYFHLKMYESRIVAIEPDPTNFIQLEKNLSKINSIKLIQKAVGSEDGERSFFSVKNQGMSSSFIENNLAENITVKALSLKTILDELKWEKVDLVKFDVEGAEWEVFSKAPIDRVGALIGEYHEDLVGRPLEDFLELFSGFKHVTQELSRKRYIVYLYREEVK